MSRKCSRSRSGSVGAQCSSGCESLFAPACSRLRKNGGHTSPRLRVAPNKKTGFNCFSQLRNAAGGANGSITLSIVRLCTNVHGWAQLAPLLLSLPIYPNKILCSCATGCTLSSQNRANACKAGLARLQLGYITFGSPVEIPKTKENALKTQIFELSGGRNQKLCNALSSDSWAIS